MPTPDIDARTTRAENPGQYQIRSTPQKWARIIGIIIRHQNSHRGQTPTAAEIGDQIHLSPQTVRYHIERMHSEGLLKIESWSPLHVSVPNAKEQTPMTLDLQPPAPKPAKVKGAKRTADRVIMSRRIAAFIDGYEKQYGTPPLTATITEHLGFRSSSAVTRWVKFMVDQDWLVHEPRHHGDYRLTDKGRLILLDNPAPAKEPVGAPPSPSAVESYLADPGPADAPEQAPEAAPAFFHLGADTSQDAADDPQVDEGFVRAGADSDEEDHNESGYSAQEDLGGILGNADVVRSPKDIIDGIDSDTMMLALIKRGVLKVTL